MAEDSSTGFYAGAISGLVGVTLSFPFESYRLRLLFTNSSTTKSAVVLRSKALYHGLPSALLQVH